MKTTNNDFNISQSDIESLKKAAAEVAQSFKAFQAAIGKAGYSINKGFKGPLLHAEKLSREETENDT